jgi:protein gp37
MGWSKKPWTKENAAENFVLHPERLRLPYRWKEPRRVFVNSMSDLFHELMPPDFLAQVFAVMNDLPKHTFQILTKRPEIAAAWPGPWTPNIWMGTSVENQRAADKRIPYLLQVPAAVRFLSCEPLLGPIDLSRIVVAEGVTGWGPRRRKCDALTGWQHDYPPGADHPRESLSGRGRVDWVIVGGESGPHHRPMEMSWARRIRDFCVAQDVAFFFKQDADFRNEQRPYLVEEDGSAREWHQYPDHLSAPRFLGVNPMPAAAEH